ncbi:unnamed protein product [Periconia digitata]|uniref:Uncharacterized protein n=1 Tax=Periconia digitata TaxID=1303443 RepID=A0A9W4XWL2_9PLEO|nr:unnamed protein product [Periconia digitata]
MALDRPTAQTNYKKPRTNTAHRYHGYSGNVGTLRALRWNFPSLQLRHRLILPPLLFVPPFSRGLFSFLTWLIGYTPIPNTHVSNNNDTTWHEISRLKDRISRLSTHGSRNINGCTSCHSRKYPCCLFSSFGFAVLDVWFPACVYLSVRVYIFLGRLLLL